MSTVYQQLLEYATRCPVINTHSHHIVHEQQRDLGLQYLLENSYVAWRSNPPGNTPGSREAYLAPLRSLSCFHWLERGLQAACGMAEPLTVSTWDAYDRRVRELTSDPDHHWRVLEHDCGYARIILDSLAPCGIQQERPALFAPTYRVNMYAYGYQDDLRDHNGRHPQLCCNWEQMPSTYSDYIDRMAEEIKAAKEKGHVALKSALAYDRSLDFQPVSRQQAAAGYRNPKATPQQILDFQNGVYDEFCAIAAELDLPFQNHTGLGLLKHSNAMQLRPAIERHPRTQFVLFHGGYPWLQDVLGLTMTYPNTHADLCWLPLLSTSACERFLMELLEMTPLHRIAWGCDTWHSFESLGAVLAIREVLATVFARKVSDGSLSLQNAMAGIESILYTGPKALYKM